jgi:YD repeat-containing protein
MVVPNGYKKELSYDAFGRVSSTTLTTNGEKLTTTNTYDSYSRLLVLFALVLLMLGRNDLQFS